MPLKDLHLLPKFRDSLSYLYVEHCRVEQDDLAVAIWDAQGKVPVPCAGLAVLMLGPGTSITHAAVTTLADNGCLLLWCGEEGVRLYAQGLGLTRSAAYFLHQVRLWADPQTRLEMVRRLYQHRFPEPLAPHLTLKQIRGQEGVRVREAYAQASRQTGVPWHGRAYRRDSWHAADPINRALSAANSCLYGICHAAVLALGLSPALGFIHTGKMLSFVYDVADLYKTRFSIPIAFQQTAASLLNLESRVRQACREEFRRTFFLKTIIQDLQDLLQLKAVTPTEEWQKFHRDQALPGDLWDPTTQNTLPGGHNFAPDSQPNGDN